MNNGELIILILFDIYFTMFSQSIWEFLPHKLFQIIISYIFVYINICHIFFIFSILKTYFQLY